MLTSKKLLALSFAISICIFISVSKASDHDLATVASGADNNSYQLVVYFAD